MAAPSKFQVVNFAGGETDSYADGRIDLDVHPTTAQRLENVFLTEQGAMELAPGSLFMRATPSNGVAIVRPWMFNLDNAFCLEFSDELLRFISGDAYVTLTGAAATVGTFSDESAVAPAGGDPPPSGEGGDGVTPPPEGQYCYWEEYGEGSGGYWICTEVYPGA